MSDVVQTVATKYYAALSKFQLVSGSFGTKVVQDVN